MSELVTALATTLIHVTVQQPDAWGWTPTTVAAGATALLALLTAALAWSTRRLATSTRDDVQAEFRPVLIGAATGSDGVAALGVEPAMIGTGRASLDLILTNVGKGPAINIAIALQAFGFERVADELPIERGTLGWGEKNPHLHTRFEDEPFLEVWPTSEVFGYRFDITYYDLRGGRYRTQLRYERAAHEVMQGEPQSFKIKAVDTKVSTLGKWYEA